MSEKTKGLLAWVDDRIASYSLLVETATHPYAKKEYGDDLEMFAALRARAVAARRKP